MIRHLPWAWFAVLALTLAVAGCGGGEELPTATPVEESEEAEPTTTLAQPQTPTAATRLTLSGTSKETDDLFRPALEKELGVKLFPIYQVVNWPTLLLLTYDIKGTLKDKATVERQLEEAIKSLGAKKDPEQIPIEPASVVFSGVRVAGLTTEGTIAIAYGVLDLTLRSLQ